MDIKEIQEFAKSNDEFRKNLVTWAANSTEEGKGILQNFFKAEFDNKIGEKISEIHLGYDNDIFEVLGERKKTDQKTYDYVKELAKELKTLREKKGGNNEAKIAEYEAKIKELQDSGEANKHWKNVYDDALAKWVTKEEEYKNSIQEKEKEFINTRIKSELDLVVKGLKIKPNIPQEAVEALIRVNENKILENAKIIDGKVVFHKEDGTVWMNEEFKPISAEEVAKSFLNPLLDDGNPGGGGAPSNFKPGQVVKIKGEGGNVIKKLILDKGTFSTRLEFNRIAEKALQEQGVAISDKDYNTILDNAYLEYGVADLELQ